MLPALSNVKVNGRWCRAPSIETRRRLDTTRWGMSSSFRGHDAPGLTVTGGLKTKLSMLTLLRRRALARREKAPASPAASGQRRRARREEAEKGLIEAMVEPPNHARAASVTASGCTPRLTTLATPSTVRSLSAGISIGPAGRLAGRRLREGGRPRGVERDVALHLLDDLVDVAVEHRHRAKALQQRQGLQPSSVPQPHSGVDRPQRDMGENDDRRGRRLRL